MSPVNPSFLSGLPVTIAAILVIGIGVLFCFFGYRLFKLILAIAGFIWGFALVGGLVYQFTTSTLAALISGAIGGIGFAVLAALLYYVGVFILGAYLGAMLGYTLAGIIGFTAPLWIMLALALAGGILAVIFHRTMVILTTAFVGAWSIVSGFMLITSIHQGSPMHWVMFFTWIAIGVVGMIVQFRITAKQKLAEDRTKE